jgi:hypothetical protein
MVETTVTRSLPVLGPLILLIAIGLSLVISRFPRSHRGYVALSLALLTLLSGISLYIPGMP